MFWGGNAYIESNQESYNMNRRSILSFSALAALGLYAGRGSATTASEVFEVTKSKEEWLENSIA